MVHNSTYKIRIVQYKDKASDEGLAMLVPDMATLRYEGMNYNIMCVSHMCFTAIHIKICD